MIKATTKLVKCDGDVLLRTEAHLGYNERIRIDEWDRMGRQNRRKSIERHKEYFERYVSEAYQDAIQKSVDETIERFVRAIGPANEHNHMYVSGICEMGRAVQGALRTRLPPIFYNPKVETVESTVSYLDESRAPYSYEFEKAIMPSPPVVPDPYWKG